MYGSSSGAQNVTVVDGEEGGGSFVVETWFLDLPGASLSWAVNCSSSEKRISIFILHPVPACG